MGIVTEVFSPRPLSASTAISAGAVSVGGFFCSQAGQVQYRDGATIAAPIVVAVFPVVAGVFYPTPFAFGNGLYVEIAGGAIITMAVV